MKQLLRETWQIWYWAYFQPSRLQAWINEVGKQGDGWLNGRLFSSALATYLRGTR